MPSDPNPAQSAADEIIVEGQVERITFENCETSFRVVRVRTDDPSTIVTVVGRIQQVAVGSRLRATGRFEIDPRHGKQLHASSVLVVDPDTVEGLARYLGSGLIPGVGPVFAKRIVDTFGDKTLEVLDAHPERLAEVPKLGKARRDKLLEVWAEHRSLRDVMVFLQGHGVSSALALRVFRRYGKETIRIVSDNPYRLALDVWGIGFKKADEIASKLGIARDAPARVRAAILHVIDQMGERGHVFSPRTILATEAANLTGVDIELVERSIDEVCSGRAAQLETLDDIGSVVYGARRYAEETGLARGIARLARARVRPLAGADEAIAHFERTANTQLAPAQRDAVRQAANVNVLVITGGPGVGKTTLVKALINLYERARLRVRLAAPTGRASRRMAESTAREAQTLHRLLEFDPRQNTFSRTDENPLEVDVVIIDEASMVDLSLAYAVARAIPPGARLVLVGDVDQLPSIGPGAVLRDIIDAQVVTCVRLVEIFRQAAGSRIVHNAHRIREGLLPENTPAGNRHGDFYIVNAKDAQDAADKVLLLTAERIPKQFGWHPARDVQVLTPMHRGAAGSDLLNERLQQQVNPDGRAFTIGGRQFRLGDKVMQLRNDYARDVYNGDTGFIRAFDPDEATVVVNIDGRDVTYETSQVDELRLAYACSIHKSQGSEYPAVVVVMIASHFIMLTRNLLYTAVTRGKQLVVLVTDQRALRWAVSDERREERYTYLHRRLRAAMT